MYKYVNIYADTSNKLIGVPCGKSAKSSVDVMELDIYSVLEPGYDSADAERFIEGLFDLCYTKKCHDGDKSAIEIYYNKSYSTAARDLKLVTVYLMDSKITLYPSVNEKRGRFCGLPPITIPQNYKPGELSEAFKEALNSSVK